MRVRADRDVCIGAGVCVMNSEAVFDQDDDGIVVLLVDDEEELRRSTAQALELQDLTVESFASGEDALARVSYAFNGVVVSDIRMPGVDGLELLQRLHEHDPDLLRMFNAEADVLAHLSAHPAIVTVYQAGI